LENGCGFSVFGAVPREGDRRWDVRPRPAAGKAVDLAELQRFIDGATGQKRPVHGGDRSESTRGFPSRPFKTASPAGSR
jgi:hypothetical protein